MQPFPLPPCFPYIIYPLSGLIFVLRSPRPRPSPLTSEPHAYCLPPPLPRNRWVSYTPRGFPSASASSACSRAPRRMLRLLLPRLKSLAMVNRGEGGWRGWRGCCRCRRNWRWCCCWCRWGSKRGRVEKDRDMNLLWKTSVSRSSLSLVSSSSLVSLASSPLFPTSPGEGRKAAYPPPATHFKFL